MHSCRVTSATATTARLCAKQAHADRRPPTTKPEQRRRKADRRDFAREIALVVWGAASMFPGVEL